MRLDPFLLEVIACPCPRHVPLRTGTETDPAAEVLECVRCRSTFPVTDDIPVLLLDEATPGPEGIGADLAAGTADGPASGGPGTVPA